MKKVIIFLLLFIFIISIFLFKLNIFNVPFSFARTITKDIITNFQELSFFINTKKENIINTKKIIEENKRLTEDNTNLTKRLNDLIEKNKNTEIINASINFVSKYNYKFAKVLTIDKQINNTLTISLGKNDGLDIGYPVVFKDGFMIGKVVSVYDNFSIVLLTIDKNSEIAATVSGYEKNIGILKGNNGLDFVLNYVSIKEQIKKDDILITSGIEKNIPAGLILGKISSVNFIPSDFFQKVEVEPIMPFENFRVLSVIMP